MSVEHLTKFQGIERKLDEWEIGGRIGAPPEYVLFRSPKHGVTAAIDPFATWRFGVVAWLSKVGVAGEHGHLAKVHPSERAKLALVAHFIGGKILEACGAQTTVIGSEHEPEGGIMRVVERVDGFAVPEDPHMVLGATQRGAQYPRPSELEQLEAFGALGLSYEEDRALGLQLTAIDVVAPLLDNTGLLIRSPGEALQLVDQVTARLDHYPV
jgi:hypothetical protein